MKVAITSTGVDLNSDVDPRFGRCAYFLFVDTDTMKFEAIENPNVSAMGGAGIQSAQLVANKGVEALLTGSCGPNAFQTLRTAKVQVIVGVTGTVQDAIKRYKKGELQSTGQPNVTSHFGVGMGMGRGMGMGKGMGGGMGYGQMPQAPGMGPTMPQLTKEQELQMLKQQSAFMKQQIEEINKRIKELEKGGD